MFMRLPRSTVQAISACLFGVGSIILCMGGWHDEYHRSIAISFMAASIWFVMMSESILLGKIQTEMTAALESLRGKQESEVRDLLYFLRQAKLSANPLESWDAAKAFLDVIPFPAMVITSNHQIVKANEKITSLLGHGSGELNGTPAHMINHPIVMSKIGELCAKPSHVNKPAMHTRYAYMHKTGNIITGGMDASLMVDGGFFVVFHPDIENVISYKDLNLMLS